MSIEQIIVLALLLLPLVAAVVVWCLGPQQGPAIRAVSSATSVVLLLLAAFLAYSFLNQNRHFASSGSVFVPTFVPGSTLSEPHKTTWTIVSLGRSDGNVQFFLGIDGLNLWLIVLTALLALPCVLVSYDHVTDRVNEFYAWLLALQTSMIGVFLAFDIVVFYVFFELTLVPLFFLVGIWGGSQRQYAARKFVIYTLAGSLITLLGVFGVVLALASQTQILTFSIPEMVDLLNKELAKPDALKFWGPVQTWVFLALALGFAIKVPLLPFHTWLPLAHTEAPTAGSAILAGVLLKVGCYGFLRLCIPLAPDASLSVGMPLITWLAAIGVVYGAFCAFAQEDVKKLIAYSSVSHLGLVMLGMFSLTLTGLQGSLIQMINHGLSTPLLFLLIGMLYERYHTRMLKDYSGMAAKLPLFAFFLVFATLSSIGLPGLNGFVGEFLCLAGIYEQEAHFRKQAILPILTVLGASGMLLGAWYMMTMLRRVLFGPLHEPHHEGHAQVSDLNARERLLLTPLALVCLVLGVYPNPVLKTSEPEMSRIYQLSYAARERAGFVQKAPAPKVENGE
jgi:NADH-quinone oxidoreductase subunit M